MILPGKRSWKEKYRDDPQGNSTFKGQEDEDDKPGGEAGENRVMETKGRQFEKGRPD